MAAVQGAIPAGAVDALRPGGTLVYSTCTISRREGEDRVAELVARERGGGGRPRRLGPRAGLDS